MACVGFQQNFGGSGGPRVGQTRAVAKRRSGDKNVYGYYCVVGAQESLDADTVTAVINAIGIKGIAVPSDLASLPVGQASTTQEQKSAPQPPIVGGFEGETFLCTEPEVSAHPVYQEWRKGIEAWKAR